MIHTPIIAAVKAAAMALSALTLLFIAVFQATQQTGTTLIGIGAIASPVMVFALGVMQWSTNRRAEARAAKDVIARQEVAAKVQVATDAATEVAKVAAKVAEQSTAQSSKILILADKTHTLVNSQYGIALTLILEKAIRISELSNTPENIADVKKARQKLAEHEAKQNVVDSKEKEN